MAADTETLTAPALTAADWRWIYEQVACLGELAEAGHGIGGSITGALRDAIQRGRTQAEAERDAALKRAEDLRAEREQTTNLIEAVERWAAARRRERGHYDLKGDLQMEIRQCERDLEDAYAATLSQPGAAS